MAYTLPRVFLRPLTYKMRTLSTKIERTSNPGQWRAKQPPMQRILKEMLVGNEWRSEIEWDTIKSKTVSTEQVVSEEAFPGSVMRHLLSENQLMTAKSLMSYLNHKNKTPNVSTLKLFLKLCASQCDGDNEQQILDVYNDLQRMDLGYNTEVLNTCIFALAGTKLWMNGIELMNTIKRNGEKISDDAYNAFVLAAFRNKKFDIGYETLKSFNPIPSNEIIIEWSNLCEDDESMSTVCKLVDFIASKKLTVPSRITDKMQANLNKKNYVGKYVTIFPDGYCAHCDSYLEKNVISDEEFTRLRDDVMNSVIKGRDLFLKTNSIELRAFENFIRSTGPYDVVVDGLNVAYNNLLNPSKNALSQQLIRVLKHLAAVKNYKNILVLGKHHMNTWPKSALASIKQLSHCFLTESLSEDDTFLLHATLASGPNTCFVSNDFMRDHIVCLKNRYLSDIFRKWQWSHQIYYLINKNDELELLPPTTFKPIAQRTETSVHIPCSEEDEKTLTPFGSVIPEKWLCCNKIVQN